MRKTGDVPNNRCLIKRRQGWYVRLAVPPRLVKTLGKTHEVRSLKTRDVDEARERRFAAIAQIRAAWREREGAAAWDPVELGLEHRCYYLDADPTPREPEPEAIGYDGSEREDAHYGITEDVDELRRVGREAAAKLLYRIATGEDAVLAETQERWLKELEGRHTVQTIRQHRQAFALLREAFPEVVLASDIDRRKAGRFVSEFLVGKGYANKTANRILSSLSSFWRWLAKRGWLSSDVNPWAGQGTHSGKHRKGPEAKRAYRSDEVAALLNADASRVLGAANGPAIADLVRLGLMTGARLNELHELQARDVLVADRAIHIREGKTANARRTIPVHATVWPIVERRLEAAGAGRDTPLAPELKPGGPDRKRSWYISKVFTRFRRRVLGEGDDVDFHSLRRTFATYLEHASTRSVKVNPQVIAELLGHEKGTLALRVYSGGLYIRHLREAVDALDEVLEPEVLKALGRTAD